MKYYIEYNLGWRGPSNIKAEKGTVVHKVMEILAILKLKQQENIPSFTDDILGEIFVEEYDLEDLITRCTDYYQENSIHEWKPIDRKHCRDWTLKALRYNDGEFDPRNLTIVQPEQSFDITIAKPWAEYEYDMPDGTVLRGNFGIKGTIDLITKIDDSTYEICDYKTGRRLNWATGEEKTWDKLNADPQLMMYYYAVQHLYPEIEHFQIVIYFINDGGPFTLCFSREDLPKIEEMLKKKFLEIKNTETPPLNKSWKCTKFCHFGMTTFEGTSVLPIIERRDGQVTPKGKFMTKCEQVKYAIEHRNQLSVLKNMSVPGHDIGYYKAPGSIE